MVPGPATPSSAAATNIDALRRRATSENFPVALRILPSVHRARLIALYAVARTIDELGDAAEGDRSALLRDYRRQIDATWAGAPPHDPALRLLAPVVVDCGLSREPFERLVEANLQDQTTTRYATFDDLRGYCRLSADPVGRTVLEMFGRSDPDTITLSDAVCTALQLVEHWQDVGEDRRAGRIYLPADSMAAHGVTEADLDAPRAGEALRALIRFETDRAESLLERGAPLVGRLDGWARLCVGGFVAGGRATIAALRRVDGDVLGQQARPTRVGTARALVPLLLGRRVTR